ncbi:hypothetical protein NL676_016088 [Syzygium grande]|nr:hypothetical protein NL676_016088 [Syzygium grande]
MIGSAGKQEGDTSDHVQGLRLRFRPRFNPPTKEEADIGPNLEQVVKIKVSIIPSAKERDREKQKQMLRRRRRRHANECGKGWGS